MKVVPVVKGKENSTPSLVLESVAGVENLGTSPINSQRRSKSTWQTTKRKKRRNSRFNPMIQNLPKSMASQRYSVIQMLLCTKRPPTIRSDIKSFI